PQTEWGFAIRRRRNSKKGLAFLALHLQCMLHSYWWLTGPPVRIVCGSAKNDSVMSAHQTVGRSASHPASRHPNGWRGRARGLYVSKIGCQTGTWAKYCDMAVWNPGAASAATA